MVSEVQLFEGMRYDAFTIGIQTAEIVTDRDGNATLTLRDDLGGVVAEKIPIKITDCAANITRESGSIGITLRIGVKMLKLSIPKGSIL